ncbi:MULTISPECIES: type II secretion system F family protein [Cyanophyceae]|uniref:type II secretion system F family protein n=1 Tax=Cyanophyceae TaxID=3028117 RepID=UPI0016843F45|nr:MULTISPECIES: type II secretion system F family protein [Cyanophyceae]MBD1916936.1 type II secretion system F family protein [Phormidium sp. FACHB-77]MBD2029787.1 type II secretion system F family protein [Phormidium sp. FACHB-322]MBD2050425.1 type II secretion system F family protein [Leptolyngbya sp. FACHB-60]
MPTYVAIGRDTSGAQRKERISAETPNEARNLLKDQGLYVMDIKEEAGFNIDLESIKTSMTKVTVKDKAIFSRQFAALVNAGVALVRGLGVLADDCANPKLKKALMAINADVQQGTNLSDAMRKHPACFDNLYVALIQAGEVGGVLDEVLNRLAKLLEDLARLQNQIKSAMAYPVTVGFLAVIIFVGMTVFLLPIFADMFEDLGADLPIFTQVMMMISRFLRQPLNWVFMIAAISALSFAYRRYYATLNGRRVIDRLSLKMPLFGDLIQKTATARFCRTFGSLSKSGVPILTALEIVRDTAGNQVIAEAVDDARKDVQGGGMISLALQKHSVFPGMAIQMISIGEETGELDAMLMKVADFYEDEVEQAVKALTSIMEPIMIVVLGGMVGSILISMYLPMFKIMDAIG